MESEYCKLFFYSSTPVLHYSIFLIQYFPYVRHLTGNRAGSGS